MTKKLNRLAFLLLFLLLLSTLFVTPLFSAPKPESLTLSDLSNLVTALKVVQYKSPHKLAHTTECLAGGVLAQQVIRRIVKEGITTDLAIQKQARADWPTVETKVGMTWMALCQGGSLNKKNSLTLAQFNDLVNSLKIVHFSKPTSPSNSTTCSAMGLLARQMIRRIVNEGITKDPAIQQQARADWPTVETKVGMTWMAVCTGGNIQ